MQDSLSKESVEEEQEASLLPRSHASESRPGRWVFWVFAAAALAVIGLAAGALSPVFPRSQGDGPASVRLRGIEAKYYEHSGEYWQAPGKGISTSEFWSGCDHPHMAKCKDFCCCNEGFYWHSPKTVYKVGKAMLNKSGLTNTTAVIEKLTDVTTAGSKEALEKAAAAGAASGTLDSVAAIEKAAAGTSAGASGTVTTVEATVKATVESAAVKLGKAAVTSMFAKGQRCVPKSEAPAAVVKALQGSEPILGSANWNTCSSFTPHSHTCGQHCCCNGGYGWSSRTEACVPA